MKKTIWIIIAAFFLNFGSTAIAQNSTEMFMPKQIKKAYENGTRSWDGKPGKNYFQNQTDYQIKADFFPDSRIINGSEIITYKNNSKDSLDKIYLKLYQDLFKKGSARDWDLGPVDIHDGVDIKSIKVNGKPVDLSKETRRNATIMRVSLSDKISPSSKNKIEIEWSLIIPGTIPVRMGTYNKTNFMIAYWYPKLAVYDDISGWNTIPHTGNCEYYNEYGDFDVEITVPSDYLVWSSGILQNAKSIFTSDYLMRLNQAAMFDKIIHVVSKEDWQKNNITKKVEKHTWKFRAENLPDFAFALSNKYLWDATSIDIDGKRISIHAVYNENSIDFNEVADLSRKSIEFFSHKTPGIKFPYPQLIAFNGSGGMEFPGMINDGDAADRNGTIYVTAHEIGHTYFPFYVGTNEQKYAWIDEGLITFLPRKIVAEYTADKDFQPYTEIIRSYNYYAGSDVEMPLMVNSTNTGQAYRYHAYSRSSVAFFTLHEYLGEDKFNKGLQLYSERWNGKHPTPYDLFFSFNEAANEDLSWFWKPWFFELGYADLAIGKIIKNSDNQIIEIENKGGFPVQVNLNVIYKNGDKKTINKSAEIWKSGVKIINVELPAGELKSIHLDLENTPDASPENNILEL